MSEGDTLERFDFPAHPIRGLRVRLNATWREALSHSSHPEPVQRLLGEAMAATALLTATLKFRGRLSLQIDGGGGELGMLLVQCDHELHLRGTARHRPAAGGQLLAAARLSLTLEPLDQGRRYQGIVPLESPALAPAVEHYLAQSEQLPTRLWLAGGTGTTAGLLLQRMPGEADDADAWNRLCRLAATIKDEELLELPTPLLLHRLFHEEDIRLFDSRAVSFRCGCSRRRVVGVLQSLGAAEVEEILAEQGQVEVTCEFCGRVYRFDAVDAALLFASEQPPVSAGRTRH